MYLKKVICGGRYVHCRFFPGIMLADFIAGLALPKSMILPGIILICVIWGCVMDGDAIMILTVPIIFPVVQAPEFDPI